MVWFLVNLNNLGYIWDPAGMEALPSAGLGLTGAPSTLNLAVFGFQQENKPLEMFFAQGCIRGAFAGVNLAKVIFWKCYFGIYWGFSPFL